MEAKRIEVKADPRYCPARIRKIVYDSRLIPDTVAVTTDGVEGNGTPFHGSGKEIRQQRLRDHRRSRCEYAFLQMNDRTLSMTAKGR